MDGSVKSNISPIIENLGLEIGLFADFKTHVLSAYLINPARNIGMVKNDSQEPTDFPRQENDAECHS